MIKNIFITGLPGSGKTTLIRNILKELKLNADGFYTQEIRRGSKRLGFKIKTLNGREGVLSHVTLKSLYRVGKYRVNIKDLEEIGVKSILEALRENKVIVIDEIGKQEMCSSKFKKAIISALNSKNKVLGTIKLTYDPFTDKIKKRKDTKVFYLTKVNREKIKKEIKRLLKNE